MIEEVLAESIAHKEFTLLLSPSPKSTFIANLDLGQLLEGKVVRSLGNHRFLIDFAELKVVAESMVPLKPGQQIQARAVQIHPQVVMSLVTEGISDDKELSLIRSYLPSRVNWGELVENLGKVLTGKELHLLEMVVDSKLLEKVISSLSSLSFDEEKVGSSEKIRQFVEHSGLLYESKLREFLLSGKMLPKQFVEIVEKDFKGLLLKLSQELEKTVEIMNKDGDIILKNKVLNLLSTVNSSIKKIELHQLVNHLTAKNDQQLVFQIPLILPEGIKTAELYIRYGYKRGKKKKVDQDECHIVFLLNMRDLGDLRIDTHLVKKRIRCTIQADSIKIVDFVRQNISELSNRLESLDYKVEKISCMVREEEVKQKLPLEGFSLLEMRLVDIIA